MVEHVLAKDEMGVRFSLPAQQSSKSKFLGTHTKPPINPTYAGYSSLYTTLDNDYKNVRNSSNINKYSTEGLKLIISKMKRLGYITNNTIGTFKSRSDSDTQAWFNTVNV